MTDIRVPKVEADDDERFVGHVELGLPARPDLLFLARMTAAAVASRADFGYDQIEDLRLALDELCLTILGGYEDADGATAGARIQLRLRWSDDSIEVTAALVGDTDSVRSHGDDAPRPNELSERILDALVDEHGAESRDGTVVSWLRLRRREATA
jgi:anti-sigma regulatory factor (Ser/Thr protein kinase)